MEGAATIAAAMRFARNRNDKAAKAMLSGGAAGRIKLAFHQQPEGEGPIITWQKREQAVVKLFGRCMRHRCLDQREAAAHGRLLYASSPNVQALTSRGAMHDVVRAAWNVFNLRDAAATFCSVLLF